MRTFRGVFPLTPMQFTFYVNRIATGTGIPLSEQTLPRCQCMCVHRQEEACGTNGVWRHALESEVRREPPHAGQTD